MPTSPPEAKKSINDLIAIMEALRAPETGCPWDAKQTYETIAPYTIEEAYEVLSARSRIERSRPVPACQCGRYSV